MEIRLRAHGMQAYHVLDVMGKPVWASAEPLREAVAARLGEGHARLFAVPRLSEDGQALEWYAQGDGRVVPWNKASENERKAALEELKTVFSDLKVLASGPVADKDPAEQALREVMKLALFVPERAENLFLVEGKPVVAGWGQVTHDLSGDNDILSALCENTAQAPGHKDQEGSGGVVSGKRNDGRKGGRGVARVFGLALAALLLAAGIFYLLSGRETAVPGQDGESHVAPAVSISGVSSDDPVVEPPSPVTAVAGQPADVDVPESKTPSGAMVPEMSGKVRHLYEAGVRQVRQGDFVEALDSLKRAADAGSAEAMAAYADLRDPVVARRMGRPLGVVDGEEALDYYRKAQDAGLAGMAERRERLAEYIEQGQGPVGGGYRNEAW